MVSSILVLSLILILSPTSNAQDAVNPVCLWNRYSLYDRYMNGLYRFGGIFNNRPYYKLDRTGQGCAHDYLWMYFVDSFGVGEGIGWHIGFGNNGQFGFDGLGTMAWCDNPYVVDPWDCGTNWKFVIPWTGEWYVDGNVTVKEGLCPALRCAAITIPKYGTLNSDCSSFDGSNTVPFTQIGDNQYTLDKQGYSNRVWVFNDAEFQWQCINTDTHSVSIRCDDGTGFSLENDGLINFAEYQPWQDLSRAETIQITGIIGVGCTDGSCTASLTCQGSATTTTLPPTTPNPTIFVSPTPRPTFKPLTASPSTASPTDTTDTGYPTVSLDNICCNCLTASSRREFQGCAQDILCERAVCAIDSFCCDDEWDEGCVEKADALSSCSSISASPTLVKSTKATVPGPVDTTNVTSVMESTEPDLALSTDVDLSPNTDAAESMNIVHHMVVLMLFGCLF